MARNMRFAALAVIETTGMATSAVLSIALAVALRNYWAIVVGTLSFEIVSLALTWWLSGWRPAGPRWESHTRPLLAFGVNVSAANILYSLARSMDHVLIGRFSGAAALGTYSRASALLTKPLEQFLNPLGSVFIPTLARLQNDPSRCRRVFLEMIDGIALVTAPFAALALVLARPLTLALLGTKWADAAPVFGALALIAWHGPLGACGHWFLMSQGRGKDLLQANTLLSLLTVLAFVGGLPFGAFGVAISYSLSGLVMRLPLLYGMIGRTGPVTRRDLVAASVRSVPLYASTIATSGVALMMVPDAGPVQQLVICAPPALVVAALIMMLTPRYRQTVLRYWSLVRGGRGDLVGV